MSKKKTPETKDAEAEAPVVETPAPTEPPVEEPTPEPVTEPADETPAGDPPDPETPVDKGKLGPNGLPLYQCHKQVEAVKIARFDGYAIVSTEGTRIGISADYLTRYSPQIGGYWVKYADGYTSYSPAEAFEEGYSRI